ncbi:MAG: metal ABC transporter permease [Thermoanaerobaculia bacterium]
MTVDELKNTLANVGRGELVLLGVVTVLVLAALALVHKELELTSFDPVYAEAVGIRTDRLRYLLLGLIALAVVSAVRAVGVLLTAALLVTPAAAASLLTASLPRMMVLGTGLAVGSAIAGLWLSLRFDLPSGAAIVLVCTAGFTAAWLARAVRHRGG